MKLKMWIGNLDGHRYGLVIAPSKEQARKVAGTGRSDFDGHWTLQSGVDPSLEPEVLYTCPMRPGSAREWQRGRCPITKAGG